MTDIRAKRLERSWSQTDLAQHAHVSTHDVRIIEEWEPIGANPACPIDLRRYAHILNALDIDYTLTAALGEKR